VKTVMNLRFPQNVGNSLTSCGNVSFKRMNLLHCMSDQIIYLRIFMHLFFPLAVQMFSVTPGTFSSQASRQSRCLCRQVRTFGTAPPDAANRPKMWNIKSVSLHTSVCCELSHRQHTASPTSTPTCSKVTNIYVDPLRPSACRTGIATEG